MLDEHESAVARAKLRWVCSRGARVRARDRTPCATCRLCARQITHVQSDSAPRQRGRRRRPSAARQGGGHPGSACRSRRRASKRQRPAAACRRARTLWRPVDAAVGKQRASTRAPRDAVLWRRPAGRRERARARTCAPRAGGTRARPAAWARQVHGEARPPAGGPIVSLGGCPATGLGTSCTARQQQRPQPRRPEPLAK